jgi:hypothetical protein
MHVSTSIESAISLLQTLSQSPNTTPGHVAPEVEVTSTRRDHQNQKVKAQFPTSPHTYHKITPRPSHRLLARSPLIEFQ